MTVPVALALRDRITKNAIELATNIDAMSVCLPCSKEWINSESSADVMARGLLTASRVCLLEAATSWSLGLSRAAVGSLRTFIENVVSWLYYKDHPIEYKLVVEAKFELMLPKAVQKYLSSIDNGFDAAYKFLEKSKVRPNEYYYTDISAFVHAHPNFILAGKDMSELVVADPPEPGFLDMCRFADEFVSDQFITHYRHSWGSVPLSVQTATSERLGKKLADFLAVP